MSDINTLYFTDEAGGEDGLIVTIDDETNILTFTWDPDTHPQWNYLQELGEDGVKKLLMDYVQRTLEETLYETTVYSTT
jgi:hypothetical protein